MRRWIIIATILTGSSCATTHIAAPELPLPVKPILPEIQGQDLQCLMPATYDALVKRDRLLHAEIAEMMSVICTTRPKPCP